VGFPDYPATRTAEPYLNYVSNRYIGRGTLHEYLALFVRVIEHFNGSGTTSNDPMRLGSAHSVQTLLDQLAAEEDEVLFADTTAGSAARKEDVEDTVMYILGGWCMMLSSFVQLPNGLRKVTAAYNGQGEEQSNTKDAYNESLAGLIRGSNLLPAPGVWSDPQDTPPEDEIVQVAMKLVELLSIQNDTKRKPALLSRSSSNFSMFEKHDSSMLRSKVSYHALETIDSIESLSIKATRLNAFTLNVLGAVDISWTCNVTRHLLLTRRGGRWIMEVFAMPCVFKATSFTSETVGIPAELAQEIQESYCILFNGWPKTTLHARIARYSGLRRFCWCWSCSASRYRNRTMRQLKKGRSATSTSKWHTRRTQTSRGSSEFDPQLIELMNENELSDWTHDLFPSLWPRITALEQHVQDAKPWSIWILFRDRRDTLQFWTFL
jgi:hypothetical protein